jgi:hypothetical protein
MKQMQRASLVFTAAAGAFLVLGAAFAQAGSPQDNRGGTQMMMGPMAGCPMGAGQPGMMAGHMMGSGHMGSGHMGPGGKWSADVGPQLDALRSTLAIKPAQKQAWDNYAAAARADAQSMSAMHERMMGFMKGQPTSSLDWLRVHRDMMRARADSLDALTVAAERLYGQLDATQKSGFDNSGGGLCGASKK